MELTAFTLGVKPRGTLPAFSVDTIDDIDGKLYNEIGITKSRFAESCSRAVEELSNDPDLSDRAYEIGMDVIKDPDGYEEVGTYPGFNRFVSIIQRASHTTLLTAGIEDVQRNKIDGFGLNEYFDRVRIVKSGGKKQVLNQLGSQFDEVVHVGNSASSDIKPAMEAGVSAIHVTTSDWLGGEYDDEEGEVFRAKSLRKSTKILQEEFL